ncbi:MAG: hypothetical protein ABJO38_10575 [Stappiaceae bacterium]
MDETGAYMGNTMIKTLLNAFGSKKIAKRLIKLREGNLNVILKERNSERFVFMRFSYPGNVQYHTLYSDDIDQVIETLQEYRSEMKGKEGQLAVSDGCQVNDAHS